MYDPTIGRWISEDPMGFQAGDANLYRYVGNDPQGATDASGLVRGRVSDEYRELEQQNLEISSLYPARVNFWGDPDIARRQRIRQEMLRASDRIRKALDALENHWCRVQSLLRNNGDLSILFGPNQPTEANRSFYIRNLRAVLGRLQDANGAIAVQLNETDRGDAVAYTYRFGSTIYINPNAFGFAHDLSMMMVHELGRLIPRITGKSFTEDYTNNIANWDDLIRCLSDNYDRVVYNFNPNE